MSSRIPGARPCHVTLSGSQAILLSAAQGLSIRLRPAAGTSSTVIRFRIGGSRGRSVEIPDGAVMGCTPRARHLFLLLLDAARSRVPGWGGMALSHLAALILLELPRGAAAAGTGGGDAADLVDAFINARRNEPVSTRDIAAALGYNPDYLERAYRARRGRSIGAAVRARRIKEACVLLGGAAPGSAAHGSPAPATRVAEVAHLCGYAEAGPFRRAFKRAAGMVPREYRAGTGSPG